MLVDVRRKVNAFQVFHHQVRPTNGGTAHVQDAPHVLAANLDGGTSLAKKSRDVLLVFSKVGKEQLDGNAFVQVNVRGREDHAHSADADHPFDAIFLREDLPDLGNSRRDGGARVHPVNGVGVKSRAATQLICVRASRSN